MSFQDVRKIERALEIALKASLNKLEFETRMGGDRVAEIDIVGYQSGRPILPELNITRLAEIMESELS